MIRETKKWFGHSKKVICETKLVKEFQVEIYMVEIYIGPIFSATIFPGFSNRIFKSVKGVSKKCLSKSEGVSQRVCLQERVKKNVS